MTTFAIRLEQAGYQVLPTDVPGLFDVPGLARDVTLGQLCDLASRHGAINVGSSSFLKQTMS